MESRRGGYNATGQRGQIGAVANEGAASHQLKLTRAGISPARGFSFQGYTNYWVEPASCFQTCWRSAVLGEADCAGFTGTPLFSLRIKVVVFGVA